MGGIAFMVVMLMFFIIRAGINTGDAIHNASKTLKEAQVSQNWKPYVYWDYNVKCYIDRATGLRVDEHYWRDPNGNPYYYYVTKPDLFGHQRFVRAVYSKKSKWNDPVIGIPDWILNP